MATHGYTIVVGVDFSDASDRALEHAIELGNRRTDAEVHVLYVDDRVYDRFRIEVGGTASDSVGALERVENAAILSIAKVEKDFSGCRLRRLVSHFRVGLPADEIVQLAVDLDADLIVVGTHGRTGVARLVLGSTAERILRLARCPVFVVRPKDHEGAGTVPEIEPPCPQCLTKRAETSGARLWCARHSEHHIRPHRYSYLGGPELYNSETAAMGSATPAV